MTDTWTWRYEDASGAEPDRDDLPREEFASQADAETWVGEHWRELLDSGVAAVVLECEGEVVYGPMSLHPAES